MAKRFLLTALTLSLFINCAEKNYTESIIDGVTLKTSTMPKNQSQENLLVNKLAIDVQEKLNGEYLTLAQMTIDDKNNIYFMDRKTGKVTIFNEQGNLEKVLGGKGQGPKELSSPEFISIVDDKLHIFDRSQGLKIWDTEGNYISTTKPKGFNFRYLEPRDNSYYGIKMMMPDRDSPKLKFEIFKYDDKLQEITKLNELIQDQKEVYHLMPSATFSFDSEGNYFFLRNTKDYVIDKFDSSGNLLFSFGREYQKEKFTQEATDYFNKAFKAEIDFGYFNKQESPPPLRRFLTDGRDNLWVVSGEINFDFPRRENKIQENIDIFNKNGEWVYSFKFDEIGYFATLKNNLLVTFQESIEAEGKQYLNIYKINFDVLK